MYKYYKLIRDLSKDNYVLIGGRSLGKTYAYKRWLEERKRIMIEKVKKLNIIEFFKDFDTDLLELIYSRYYDTMCDVKMYYNSYFDFLEIKIDKLIACEIEHVTINYDNFSRYSLLTVDEILTYVYDDAFNEFQSLRKISLGIRDDCISDYITDGKGVLGNE